MVNVPCPHVSKEMVKVVKTVSLERLHQRTAEQIVGVSVSLGMEQIVELDKVIPQERFLEWVVQQAVECLVPPFVAEIAERLPSARIAEMVPFSIMMTSTSALLTLKPLATFLRAIGCGPHLKGARLQRAGTNEAQQIGGWIGVNVAGAAPQTARGVKRRKSSPPQPKQ